MESVYYLGVDPSISNTGVVLLNGSGELVKTIDGGKFVTKKSGFGRYGVQSEGIVNEVISLLPKSRKLFIGYEDYAFNAVNRSFSLAEYGATLKSGLLTLNPEWILLVSPSTNKKFATGNGSAGKEDVHEAAVAENDVLTDVSTDVSDAYFLALFAAFKNGMYATKNRKLLRNRMRVASSCSNFLEV